MPYLAEPTTPAGRRYAAFISYSHTDRKAAQWLHRALETYRLPPGLVREGTTRKALRPVFLDRSEFPSSSDLAASVRSALEASDFLIVVCSPEAARSRWVNEETRIFKSLGRAPRILALVVAGDPASKAAGASNDCLPRALRYTVDENGVVTDVRAADPLAADIRPGKDDRRLALLKIAAALLEVPLDALAQRDNARRQRRLVQVAAASVAGCLLFAALALFAVHSRNEAQRQRRLAEQQSHTAQRTAGFLKSLFAVSDPSEARGKSITAREVLDRGVEQIHTQLRDEPQVRADLTTTLGEVYTSLGLLNEGASLLESVRAIPALPDALSARQSAAMGDVQFQQGDLAAALKTLQRADLLLAHTNDADPELRVRVLNRLGDVLRDQDDYPAARLKFGEAQRLLLGQRQPDPSLLAAAEEGLAQCDQEEKRYAQAEKGYQRALERQIAATGDMHPRVAEILNNLGQVNYFEGDRRAAADYFKRTLAIETPLLGERHPDVAATTQNLARTLLEERHFEEARTLLEQSLAVMQAQVSEGDANMAFVFSNLALAQMGLKNYEAARPLFESGLRNAIANKHRLHGPILTDLADLDCRTGRYEQGLERLQEARPIVAQRYPDDPWRGAHLDNIRAGCLTGLKRYAEAEPLFASSMPELLPKWPPDTLYGHDALERTMRLYSQTRDTAKLAQYRKLAAVDQAAR